MAENGEEMSETLSLPDLPAAAELVEVYKTDNDVAAGMVIDEILGPQIEAFRHDRRSNALFAPAAMPGEIGIAVRASDVERAKERLRQARADGVLSDDGHLAEGGDEEGETGVG